MALSGSVSTILGATQKLLQAKAQAAWKQLATADKAGNLPAAANRQSPQNAATAAIMDMVDPATQEKLRAMRKDTDSLVEKLSSSGGDNQKEAAMRKADEAKRKLKALKLQAQMAAASGDKKAAARIAREVSQLAKELGQAAKDYGGNGTDAVTATAGAQQAATQTAATAATGVEAKGEATASGVATPAVVTTQPGAPAALATGDVKAGDAKAAAPATAAPPPAQPEEKAADQTEAAETPAAQAEKPVGAEATGEAKDAAVDDAAADGTAPDGEKGETVVAGKPPMTAAQAELQAKRDAIVKEGAERKAAGEFYSDVRGSMAQLRSLLDQMKRLARRDGEPGTAAQMDQASRDMAEGEQMLKDAAGSGTVSLPSGSLVQISV